MPEPKYNLTKLGQNELNENLYVPYMHKYPYATIEGNVFGLELNVWSINKLIHDNPKQPWRSIIWSELNRQSIEYASLCKWGMYRNVRLQMSDFSFEEKHYNDALAFLSEVVHLDLNSDIEPNFAPGLIKKLKKIQSVLQFSSDEIMCLVQNRIAGMFVPTYNCISANTAKIIADFCVGNDCEATTAIQKIITEFHEEKELYDRQNHRG